MATDVSSFKDVYKKARKDTKEGNFPQRIELKIGNEIILYNAVSIPLRYGTNPNQDFYAFFPSPDCIEAAAKEKVSAIVWPAGSMNDALIIDAANKYNIALLATLQRCFLHI
jgi:AICAR transformylase/IMP cyclohydrolase PurH